MSKWIAILLSNIAAVYLAAWLVSGFQIQGGTKEYLIAGVLLGLLNIIAKPILKTVAFPLMIITLGLFIFVINAGLVWLIGYFLASVTITSLWALVWTTLIVTGTNLVIAHKL